MKIQDYEDIKLMCVLCGGILAFNIKHKHTSLKFNFFLSKFCTITVSTEEFYFKYLFYTVFQILS